MDLFWNPTVSACYFSVPLLSHCCTAVLIRVNDDFDCRALAKMSSVISIQSEENCDQLVGLIKRQKRICKRNVEVMDSVKLGAHMAIEECQHQFRNRRWNCSTVNAISVFGNALNHGN